MSHFVNEIEDRLGYRFNDRSLALQGLTHKSYSNEQNETVQHNERLEFLGDAVLELAVSHWVYARYPNIPEGGLTRIRAEVVSEKGLAEVASQLHLGDGLRLGKGEEKSGGREKASLLSDAFEAILGAIYLDGGFVAATQVINAVFAELIQEKAELRYGSDYKTHLQECFQALFNQLPDYVLVDSSGPDHDKTFNVEVYFDDQLIGRGSGNSKKSAEQKAAEDAMRHPLLNKGTSS